jgi:putative flippase GtrA
VVQSSGIQVQSTTDVEGNAFPPTRKKQRVFWQIVRFGIVGGFNASIDILALNLLLWRFPTHNSAILVAYNTLAYALGALNSYFLNKHWTFHRGQLIIGDELVRFIAVNMIGILCNDAIFWIIAKEQSLYHLGGNSLLLVNISKLCAILGTAGVSYIGMRFWVFREVSDGKRGKRERMVRLQMRKISRAFMKNQKGRME